MFQKIVALQFVFQVPQSPKPLEFVKLEPIDISDDISDNTEIVTQPNHSKQVSAAKKLMVAAPNFAPRHKCKQCVSSFTSVKSLSAHMRVHKVSNVKVVKNTAENSMIKQEYPTTVEKLQWVCNICNTEFASLKSLK